MEASFEDGRFLFIWIHTEIASGNTGNDQREGRADRAMPLQELGGEGSVPGTQH